LLIDQASAEELRALEASLTAQYEAFKQAGLSLDLTRGKPGSEQLALSDSLDGILDNNYCSRDGTDIRNYGGLDGLTEVKDLFAPVIGVDSDEILIGGNSSLTLMYQSVLFNHFFGAQGADSAWSKEGQVKFICPTPGYDRHFTICEELGIEMIAVDMTDNGPDMDQVEALVKADASIKGIWCVPRFSNPTGIVYDDSTVERLAKLGTIAGPNFRIMWDNAYAIHFLNESAPALANIMTLSKQFGTEDNVLVFGSTSKITFAGAGLAYMGASKANLAEFKKHLGASSIGPDKVNQLRHVRFFKNNDGLLKHMRKHAELLKPRFDAVIAQLDETFAHSDMGSWTVPEGGYFVSFDARPGLAKTIIKLADEAGVKLTPAGATFPYGNDPQDRNIRLAPSFPSVADITEAMKVFAVCVQLASVQQKLAA
jgi:DNA-binding transcriptional MocR family regulator